MAIIDFIVRIIFLPALLFFLYSKAVPAMVKDIAGMVKEFFGPEIQAGKARLKSVRVRSQGAKKPVTVRDSALIGIRNTIH